MVGITYRIACILSPDNCNCRFVRSLDCLMIKKNLTARFTYGFVRKSVVRTVGGGTLFEFDFMYFVVGVIKFSRQAKRFSCV